MTSTSPVLCTPPKPLPPPMLLVPSVTLFWKNQKPCCASPLLSKRSEPKNRTARGRAAGAQCPPEANLRPSSSPLGGRKQSAKATGVSDQSFGMGRPGPAFGLCDASGSCRLLGRAGRRRRFLSCAGNGSLRCIAESGRDPLHRIHPDPSGGTMSAATFPAGAERAERNGRTDRNRVRRL